MTHVRPRPQNVQAPGNHSFTSLAETIDPRINGLQHHLFMLGSGDREVNSLNRQSG
jgi:hypothetical protein